MRKTIYKILKSWPFRLLLNPRYGKVRTVEKGKLFVSTCGFNRLGDFINNNHTMQRLKKNYSFIHCCPQGFYNANRVFFEGHCLADEFLILPDSRWKKLLFIWKMRRVKAEAVLLDLDPVVDEIYFYLAGVPVICSVPGLSHLGTHHYDFEKFGLHYVQFADVIRYMLSGKITEKDSAAFFPYKRIQRKEWQEPEGIVLSMHIGGALYWLRRWPANKYIAVVRLFLDHYKGRILLVGGKDEYEENEELRRSVADGEGDAQRIFNFCGADLNTTANVLAHSRIFLGNDSGPMNMATALNTRVISVFGPSLIPHLTPAAHDARNVAVYGDLPCIPCGDRVCKLPEDQQFSCLNDLPVLRVWTALRSACDELVQSYSTI